jgi:nucleoid DNA-binding protein
MGAIMHDRPASGNAGDRLEANPRKNTGFPQNFPFSATRILDIRGCFSKPPRMAKTTSTKDKFTKTQILDTIAQSTGLNRRQVGAVLDGLTSVIETHVNKKSVGEFVLPGLLKISTIKKPAVKARKGINPFTKEEVTFKAKPASTVVKVRPLKKLKDMVL